MHVEMHVSFKVFFKHHETILETSHEEMHMLHTGEENQIPNYSKINVFMNFFEVHYIYISRRESTLGDGSNYLGRRLFSPAFAAGILNYTSGGNYYLHSRRELLLT